MKQSKRNSDSNWKPLKRRPTPEKWILLEAMRDVWSFRDSKGRLYRCEIDLNGNERWLFQSLNAEKKWISQAEAATILGISRQAIGNAIRWNRLATVDCDGRPKLSRADVLALKVRAKKSSNISRSFRAKAS